MTTNQFSSDAFRLAVRDVMIDNGTAKRHSATRQFVRSQQQPHGHPYFTINEPQVNVDNEFNNSNAWLILCRLQLSSCLYSLWDTLVHLFVRSFSCQLSFTMQ